MHPAHMLARAAVKVVLPPQWTSPTSLSQPLKSHPTHHSICLGEKGMLQGPNWKDMGPSPACCQSPVIQLKA